MTTQQTMMITGANRGIGLEFVKHYLQLNWHVVACCRTPETATELTSLLDDYEQLDIFELDVTDYEAVDELATTLQDMPIDLLINNAGYYGPKGAALGATDEVEWRKVLEINTIAPLKLVEAFRKQLKSGQDATVACLSSKMGSMGDNSSGGSYIYRSSKAALNAIGKSLAIDLLEDSVKVVILHPGWVQTEMGGPNALIDTTQSVVGLIDVISNLTIAETGHFYDYRGVEIPW